MTNCGYYPVNANGNFQNGDVAIFGSCGTHSSGHLQIYYEGGWYSDFCQKGFWPYADGSKPNYAIYRIKWSKPYLLFIKKCWCKYFNIIWLLIGSSNYIYTCYWTERNCFILWERDF